MEISPLESNHSLPVFQQDYFKRQPNLIHQGSYLSRLYHKKAKKWNRYEYYVQPRTRTNNPNLTNLTVNRIDAERLLFEFSISIVLPVPFHWIHPHF